MKAVIIFILSLLGDYFYSVQCLLSFVGMHSLWFFHPNFKCLFFLSPSHLPVKFVLFLIFEFKPDLSYPVTMLDVFFVFILLDFPSRTFPILQFKVSLDKWMLWMPWVMNIGIINIGNGSSLVWDICFVGFFLVWVKTSYSEKKFTLPACSSLRPEALCFPHLVLTDLRLRRKSNSQDEKSDNNSKVKDNGTCYLKG